MKCISKNVLSFLKKIGKHNNREWFLENKSLYMQAKSEFEEFVKSLIDSMVKIDASFVNVEAKRSIYRIYRDVRFSKDKSPFKKNFGAYLNGSERKARDRAGYYVHIEPGKSFLGVGAYRPSPVWLKAIREQIVSSKNEFRDIVTRKRLSNAFPSFYGDPLKTSPKGFDKEHPNMEFIKMRSFIATRNLADGDILSDSFLKLSRDSFKKGQPLVAFLDEASQKVLP